MKKDVILLCEDDVNYGMLLCDYLRQRNYRVDFAKDGVEGWVKFNENHYDFCILDVMMPHINGFELAKNIRMTGSLVPILFLTARAAVEDILEGYHSGCDDYVVKPCSMDVLVCKIECILQRTHRQLLSNTSIYMLGDMEYNSARQVIIYDGEEIHLSSRENEILLILAQNANQLVERKVLLTSVWHNDSYFTSRSLSVYINHLRTILQVDSTVQIMNVHGKGYKLVIPEEDQE